MTPPLFFHVFITIPAHLGLIRRWDSPRSHSAASHAPFVPALKPVYVLN